MHVRQSCRGFALAGRDVMGHRLSIFSHIATTCVKPELVLARWSDLPKCEGRRPAGYASVGG